MNQKKLSPIQPIFEFLVTTLVIFLILTLITRAIIPPIFTQDNEDWKAYKLSKEPVDILIIGNSHARYGYQPQVIEDLLAKNTKILATGANNLAWTYYGLEELLKYQVPEVIIVETFVYDVQFRNASYTPIARTIYGTHFLKAIPAILAVMDLNNFWYAYSPFIRFHQNWTDLFKPSGSLGAQYTKPRVDGYVFSSKIVQENAYLNNLGTLKSQRQLPEEYKVYTQKIIALCNEYHVPVIFIKTPTIDSYGVFDKTQNEIITSFNGNFYDMNAEPNRPLTQIHFMDITGPPMNSHLNNLGALVNSLNTAEVIEKELGYTINEEQRINYNALSIENISFKNTSPDEVEICLTPNKDTDNLMYEFSIFNGNILDQRPAENENCWIVDKDIYASASRISFVVSHNDIPLIFEEGSYMLHEIQE